LRSKNVWYLWRHALTYTLVAIVVTGCAPRYVIDRRPIEEQLRSRPAPNYTQAEIDAFNGSGEALMRISRIPPGCAPLTPPTREMLQHKINQIEGTIRASVQVDGKRHDVKGVDIVPSEMAEVVQNTFALALTTTPCRMPPVTRPITIEIPFVLRVE
jgi:hypothetical protein